MWGGAKGYCNIGGDDVDDDDDDDDGGDGGCGDGGGGGDDENGDDDEDDDDDDHDDDDDDDADDDNGDDDDDDDDMMRWMSRTRRKMMMLRRMMLRKETRSQDREAHFARACAIEMRMSISQEPFCGNLHMPDPNPGDIVLFEPAQSKCAWTFHKSHFVWKFRGKMPDAYENTSIKHRALTVTVRSPSVWPHCLGNFESLFVRLMKRKITSAKFEKISWQITSAALMQPLQYDSRYPAAKNNSITHAAAAPSNLNVAITMRSAETELQSTIELRARTSAKRLMNYQVHCDLQRLNCKTQ